jgi:hypothetical protein
MPLFFHSDNSLSRFILSHKNDMRNLTLSIKLKRIPFVHRLFYLLQNNLLYIYIAKDWFALYEIVFSIT